MANLEKLITPAKLKELAGTAAFDRGEDYFAESAVDRLRHSGEKISARVKGSEPYQVKLWADGDEFVYDCTRPMPGTLKVSAIPNPSSGSFCRRSRLNTWPAC